MPLTRSGAVVPLQHPSHRRNYSTSAADPRSSPFNETVDHSPSTGNAESLEQGVNAPSSTPQDTAPFPVLDQPPTLQSPPRSPFHPRHSFASTELLRFMNQQQELFREERIANRSALKEQQEFMANQQRQLLSALVQRSSTIDPEAPIPPQPGPRVRMADPPHFDGSIKDTENFLSSLANVFDSQTSAFPTAESKIRYALTFLSGSAANWRKLLLREVTEGHFTFNSWNNFERKFRETFGNPHLVEEARRKLWTIKQGPRTSEDFFLEFEEIRLEAGLCEESLIMFLQAALRQSLLDDVLRRDPQPVTYSEWKAATLKADHNQRTSSATRSFHSASLPYQRKPFTFRRPYNSSQPPIPSPTQAYIPPSQNPVPQTSNDTKTRPSIPPPTTHSKPKTCWKCGKEGHFARDHPQDKTSNPKVRALLEQLDELDAAYEAASSGAETIRRMLDPSTPVEDDEDDECRVFLERFTTEHPFFLEYDE